MALNLLDRRADIRRQLFNFDVSDINNESTSARIDDEYESSDLTSYYRKKLYYIIRCFCYTGKLPYYVAKLLYETCVTCGKLVEIDTSRVKIGNLADLQHLDPTLLYNVYAKSHEYEIFICCGTFFMGVLSHVSMNSNFDQPKIVLIKQLTHTSQRGLYRTFTGLKKDEKILETLVHSLQKSHIQVIFTSSSIPIFLSNLLVKANITCVAHILPSELDRLAQVTKSTLYESLIDACEDTIQCQLGKLLILGDQRYRRIIAAECDFRMGLSIFTSTLLVPILEKLLGITFRLFSEELFIKSINGSILPITSLSTIRLDGNNDNCLGSNEFDKNDLSLEFFGTRKLKLCGMQQYTFIDNTNVDFMMPLKTWIKELLLNCTRFGCPFDNSGCNGNLSEHTLIFSNRKHNVEISFVYNYKLLALPDSNFSIYIQRCCYNCSEITPNKPFCSNITLLNFLKTLLHFRIFTHKCKRYSHLTKPNNSLINQSGTLDCENGVFNDLFIGNSKELLFSLIPDDMRSTFPFRISFKLLPFESYQFVPLVSNQCDISVLENNESISKAMPIQEYHEACHQQKKYPYFISKSQPYILEYIGYNIYLLYFRIYPEFNGMAHKLAEAPSLELIYSLHSYITKYISHKQFDKLDFLKNFPCKCNVTEFKPKKSTIHRMMDDNIIDDWIAQTGLHENVHDYIKEIRDKKLVFICELSIQLPVKVSKCGKSDFKNSALRPCVNRGHCINCNWQCFSSWQSLYIYNLMLLVYSLSQEFQVDRFYVNEAMCELYITQIIQCEFALNWNEVEFLAKLSLAKFFSSDKIKISIRKINSTGSSNGGNDLKSPIGYSRVGSKSNLNKAYDILNGLRVEEIVKGVNVIAEPPPETSRSDLGSILAKFFSQDNSDPINISLPVGNISWSGDNKLMLIYSVRSRTNNNISFKVRQTIFCMNTSFDYDIFDTPLIQVCKTTICHGSKKFAIENFFGQQFSQLRSSYGITPNQFIKSICKLERKHSTGGKSGAPLYITHDRKYVIKLLNKHELECFVQNGLKMINYFSSNRNTLLCVPFSCMKINVLSPKTILLNKTIKCIILQNVDLCNEYCAHVYGEKFSFDLKGVGLHRSNIEKISSSNYISGDSSHTNTSDSLNDSQSILGIFDTIGIDATKEFLVKSVKTMGKVKSWETEIYSHRSEEYEDDSRDVVLWDRNFFEYTKGCPLVLEEALPNLIDQIDRDTKLLSELNVVDYSMLLHIYPKTGLLCMSIIDYLRPYTWDKQVETIGKKLANITSGEMPTVLSPPEYMKRFQQQVEKLFTSGISKGGATIKLQFAQILSSQVDKPLNTVNDVQANSLAPTISMDRFVVGNMSLGGKFISPTYNRLSFMDHQTALHYNEFINE